MSPDHPFDVAQINRLLHARRSVYVRSFEPGQIIPDEIIWQLLENANAAPTHKRTEPWRFVVFRGEGLRQLAEFQAARYRERAGEKFDEAKYEKLLTQPLQCSHIIAIGLQRHPVVPEMEEIAAVACAVQNLYLSTTAYGLGGYWSTGGVTFDPAAKPFFGLGPDDQLLGFFYLGYPRQPLPPAPPRGGVREKVMWVDGQ